MNSKHKFPKNSRKYRKQSNKKSKPWTDFKGFGYNDYNQEKYEDLDMMSSAIKSEPKEKTATISPYSGTKTPTDYIDVNNHRLSTIGQTIGFEMNNSKSNVDNNRGNGSQNKQINGRDSPRVKTITKKIKLGEIRLQPKQLKALLAHHKHNTK